jgi:hypothetical protein
VAREAARLGAQLLTKPVAPAKLRSLLHWSRGERPREIVAPARIAAAGR